MTTPNSRPMTGDDRCRPLMFGEALRELRCRKRWTLRKLGDALDLSIAFLHDVEHSRRAPLSRPHIERVCTVLKTPAERSRLTNLAEAEVAERAVAKWRRER